MAQLIRHDQSVRVVVRTDLGVQSGKQPTEDVTLTSLVAALLTDRGASDELVDVEGLALFTMTLLHFRRTFVEKLFALHGKIERLATEAHPLGRDARHYADLHALAATPEVAAMLHSEEDATIKTDYDTKSREYFPRGYRPPDNLSFATSTALVGAQAPAQRRGAASAGRRPQQTFTFVEPGS